MKTHLLTILLSVGVAVSSLATDSAKLDVPRWLQLPFRSENKELELHFIDGGKLWFTLKSGYEDLTWESEGEKYWAVRVSGESRVRIGFVTKSKTEWQILWHPVDHPDSTLALKVVLRTDPP